MKTDNLEAEFGERLVTLRDGRRGLIGGLRVQVKAASADEPILDFIASDETLDRYNEVIKLDGWQLGEYRTNPVVLDSHDYSSVGKILGNSIETVIKDGKLRNRVRFATDNPLGNLAYKMARGGFIRSESVGFIPVEFERGLGPEEPARTYTRQNLLEISLVSVPANPGATIGLALKSGALVKRDITDLIELLSGLEGRAPNLRSQTAGSHSNSRAEGTGADAAHWLLFQAQLTNIALRA